MRSLLIILAVVVGKAVASVTRRPSNGLIRGVHHHTYKLPPAAAELRGWYEDVVHLHDLLRQQTAPAPASSTNAAYRKSGRRAKSVRRAREGLRRPAWSR